jgi:Uri superfamily endonuclease
VRGIYVLIIRVSQNTDVPVGKLGKKSFPKGLYAYVGSAQNSLEKRIERHFKKAKRTFWHIDYLLQAPSAKIVKVFYKNAGKAEECAIAEKIGCEAQRVPGFGCSDCRCESHLFRVRAYDFLRQSMEEYVPTSSTSS